MIDAGSYMALAGFGAVLAFAGIFSLYIAGISAQTLWRGLFSGEMGPARLAARLQAAKRVPGRAQSPVR